MHIQRVFEETINSFRINIDDNKKKIDYDDAYDSLLNFKESSNLITKKQSVNIDALNIEYVRTLRPKIYTQKSQIKHFFVTADIKLYYWSREYYNDLMPIAITPNSVYQFYNKYYLKNIEEDFLGLHGFINFRSKDDNIELSLVEIKRILNIISQITSDKEKEKELMYFVRQDFEESINRNEYPKIGIELEDKLKEKYEELLRKDYDAEYDAYKKQNENNYAKLIKSNEEEKQKLILNAIFQINVINKHKKINCFRFIGIIFLTSLYICFVIFSFLPLGLEIYEKYFGSKNASFGFVSCLSPVFLLLIPFLIKHHIKKHNELLDQIRSFENFKNQL